MKVEKNWSKLGKGESRLLSTNCESLCLDLGQGDGSSKETWHRSSDVAVCISEVNTRKNKLIKKCRYPGAREEIKEKSCESL